MSTENENNAPDRASELRARMLKRAARTWRTDPGFVKSLGITVAEFIPICDDFKISCDTCCRVVRAGSTVVAAYSRERQRISLHCDECFLNNDRNATVGWRSAPMTRYDAVTGGVAHFSEVAIGADRLVTEIDQMLGGYSRLHGWWGRRTQSECYRSLVEEACELFHSLGTSRQRLELIDILGIILIMLLKNGTRESLSALIATWVASQAARGRRPLIDGAALGVLLDKIDRSYYHPAAADAAATSPRQTWVRLRQRYGWKKCDDCHRGGRALYIRFDRPDTSICAECAVGRGASGAELAAAPEHVVS